MRQARPAADNARTVTVRELGNAGRWQVPMEDVRGIPPADHTPAAVSVSGARIVAVMACAARSGRVKPV